MFTDDIVLYLQCSILLTIEQLCDYIDLDQHLFFGVNYENLSIFVGAYIACEQ
jgi:hypothetical protein